MKLYEFVLSNDDIKVYEYEVRETEKLYIVERGYGKSYINYNAYTRIPKDIINNVSVSGIPHYLSLDNNIDNARTAFILYLQNQKIPQCQKAVEKTTSDLEKCKNTLDKLKNM